jgi:hypothetical protein
VWWRKFTYDNVEESSAIYNREDSGLPLEYIYSAWSRLLDLFIRLAAGILLYEIAFLQDLGKEIGASS